MAPGRVNGLMRAQVLLTPAPPDNRLYGELACALFPLHTERSAVVTAPASGYYSDYNVQ